jgi:hypothetical protein
VSPSLDEKSPDLCPNASAGIGVHDAFSVNQRLSISVFRTVTGKWPAVLPQRLTVVEEDSSWIQSWGSGGGHSLGALVSSGGKTRVHSPHPAPVRGPTGSAQCCHRHPRFERFTFLLVHDRIFKINPDIYLRELI